MINWFLIVSTVLLSFICFIWSTTGLLNVLFKMTFAGTAFWGAYLIINTRVFG